MSNIQDVPIFTIKNKSDPTTDTELNENKWRYLRNSSVSDDLINSTNIDYQSQLPWLTLYKKKDDLLKIRLVTTIGYVEKELDNTSTPPVGPDRYEACFIKGFPLMLQGSSDHLKGSGMAPDSDTWEKDWEFYGANLEDFSGNLQTAFPTGNWLGQTTNNKVMSNLKDKRNLIIINLQDNDFQLKVYNSKEYRKPFTGAFNSEKGGNYDGKTNPKYLVVRLDSAIEETAFIHNNEFGLTVSDNTNFYQEGGTTQQNGGTERKLYIFNYVYHGYVIHPYDVMSAFTIDYFRAFDEFGGKLQAMFVNHDAQGYNTGKDVIQINSKFFSPTHQLKDGWDSRGRDHNKIKEPYYYNFFLQPTQLAFKSINISDNISERFKVIDQNKVNLYPENDNLNPYYIDKLFWSSLTSPRHTSYTPYTGTQTIRQNPLIREKYFIGNYLNVNEVEAAYDGGQRIFNNQNADYMPIKTSTGFKACGYIERYRGDENNLKVINSKNEINMCRKTITPYYHPDVTLDEEEIYAFNWNDFEKSWTDISKNGVDTNISSIDVNNCVVLEFRNLVSFSENTKVTVTIKLKNEDYNGTINDYRNTKRKTVTLVASNNPLTDTYANNIKLENNSVTHDITQTRSVNFINNDETFYINWDSNDGANKSKHAYVIDIASGSYDLTRDNITIEYEKLDTNSATEFDAFRPNNDDAGWANTRDLFMFNANVYQIKLNTSKQDENVNPPRLSIDREKGGIINYSLNNPISRSISVYNEPFYSVISDPGDASETREKRPLFGYFNFFGLTSSEFIGGIDWYNDNTIYSSDTIKNVYINFWLSNILKNEPTHRNAIYNTPFFLLTNRKRFQNDYKDSSKLFFNPNIFYGTSDFPLSNTFGKTNIVGETYQAGNDVLLINKIPGDNPSWRTTSSLSNTQGIEITSFSNYVNPNNTGAQTSLTPPPTNFNVVSQRRLFIDATGVEFFSSSLIGKFGSGVTVQSNERVNSAVNNNNEPICIELNSGITVTNKVTPGGPDTTIKLDCLNFYKVGFVASQKNLFLSDYWKWNSDLTKLAVPPTTFDGIIPDSFGDVNRNLGGRYNVYNWKSSARMNANDINDIGVPDSIYSGVAGFHNPQRAYENQSLINFVIKVSTISVNVSHLLVNTWAGNLTTGNLLNSNSVVGLSSFANEAGKYETISGSPKLLISGGNFLTPSIEEKPVFLKIDPTAQFNFATDSNALVSNENEFSKAPMDVAEVNGTIIKFPNDEFQLDNDGILGGWFLNLDGNANGIFDTSANGLNETPPEPWSNTQAGLGERNYRTIDFNTNILSNSPTSISLSSNYTQNGGFSKEEEDFPLELLFSYPFNSPTTVTNPNNLVSVYNNSDGETTSVEFKAPYKGFKRFSKLYALKITGDESSYNNVNFIGNDGEGRAIFPETIIVNCVELPPPVQVNNFNDMLSDDNNTIKLVWKGYNFDFSTDNARGQLGNIGDIIWKIDRFQTQLEQTVTVYEGKLTPNGANNEERYNLSTYTFEDTNIRIYDKYKYTVSGTFKYVFKRTLRDDNLYELNMPFGSFTTDEIIVCKNNKFEFGRYNTTSTNLKLFRPLLLNRPEGQQDKFGNQSAGGSCLGNIFSGSTRISSTQNIYANTSNQLTKKETYVLLSKQQYRPFR